MNRPRKFRAFYKNQLVNDITMRRDRYVCNSIRNSAKTNQTNRSTLAIIRSTTDNGTNNNFIINDSPDIESVPFEWISNVKVN